MRSLVILFVTGVTLAAGQQFACPHDHGFYPHEVACDQYYSCEAGVATIKTCGNGLAFDDSDPEFFSESCDYIYNVDCSTRPERQAAISTNHCPYLYGIFSDPDDCQLFWSCWDGEASKYQCGPGLAYDPKTRICTWMDQVPECAQQRAAIDTLFPCPAPGTLAVVGSFSRHAHPEDCRQYYVCMDGIPRDYGCPIGTVFDIGVVEGQGECKSAKLVPGCESYYGDLDLSTLRRSQLQLGTLGLGNSDRPAAPATIPFQPTERRTSQRVHKVAPVKQVAPVAVKPAPAPVQAPAPLQRPRVQRPLRAQPSIRIQEVPLPVDTNVEESNPL